LLVLVVNPLARLFWVSFQDPDSGALTLANYLSAFGRWRYIEALVNSLVVGLAVGVLCVLFGVPMAWAVSRTDMPGKGLVWAAITLGAGVVRRTLRITLPLTLPAVMAAFIVAFLEAIALFGVPALIALPGRFQVMTTMLWQFFEFPPKVEVAAAYAMPLLAITVALFWFQRRIIARRGYVALTGKGGERRLIRLGRWRWPLLSWCLFVTSLSFFLPMVVVLQAAFAKAWGRGFSLDNLTLRNVSFVLFDQRATQTAAWHTFVYGGAAAIIALAVALAIAYVAHRRLVPFSSALTYVAMAPFVIPGIVLAIGFYAAYTRQPPV